VDGVIVQADHGAYRVIDPASFPGVRAVLDGRGVLDHARWVAAGVEVLRVGVGVGVGGPGDLPSA
ncbi:MAG: hypothetical protein ACR2HP_06080, partial [Ilumatobacteraceae bacterium]